MSKKSILAAALALTMSFSAVGMAACAPTTTAPQAQRYTVTAIGNIADGVAGWVAGGGDYKENTAVTVMATVKPGSGYQFLYWMEGAQVVSYDAVYTFTAKADRNLIAVWVVSGAPSTTYTVTAQSEDTTKGTVSGGGSVAAGQNVTVTATANTGYVFEGWYNGTTKVSSSAAYTFVPSYTMTLTAKFTAQSVVPSTYTVSVGSEDTNKGTVTGGGSVTVGSQATVVASPKIGYVFEGWYNGATKVSSNALYQFTPTGNISLVAKFTVQSSTPSTTYTVSVAAEDSVKGIALIANNNSTSANIAAGEAATVIAQANSGYVFAGWYDGSTQVSISAQYQFTPTGNISLVAKFTAQSSGGGTGGGSGDNGGDENANPSGTISLDPSTATTLTVVVGVDDLEESIIDQIAVEFNKTYPNIVVEVVQESDIPRFVRDTDMDKGGKADIVTCIGENVASYSDQEGFYGDPILMPLDDYMIESGFNTDAYFEAVMDMGKNPVDDVQYMIPRDYSRIVCFYNKERFDECGIAYPTDDWTWDDYLAICAQFKAAGRTAMQITQAPLDYDILNWAIVSSFGVSCILDDSYLPIGSSDPQYAGWKQGMEMARSVYESGYSLSSKDYDSTAFEMKAAAMAFLTTAQTSALASKPGLDFDVAPFPAIGNTPKVPTGAVGYGIAPNSDDKDAAWAFLQFMASEEGQIAVARASKSIPLLKSLANDTSAAWRQMTNSTGAAINTANMISYTDRDVTAGWFGPLPAAARESYKTQYSNFLAAIVYEGKPFEQAYNTFDADLKSIIGY